MMFQNSRLAKNFQSWPEGTLTAALLALAVAIIILALWPGHALLKAAALAWLLLP